MPLSILAPFDDGIHLHAASRQHVRAQETADPQHIRLALYLPLMERLVGWVSALRCVDGARSCKRPGALDYVAVSRVDCEAHMRASRIVVHAAGPLSFVESGKPAKFRVGHKFLNSIRLGDV